MPNNHATHQAGNLPNIVKCRHTKRWIIGDSVWWCPICGCLGNKTATGKWRTEKSELLRRYETLQLLEALKDQLKAVKG